MSWAGRSHVALERKLLKGRLPFHQCDFHFTMKEVSSQEQFWGHMSHHKFHPSLTRPALMLAGTFMLLWLTSGFQVPRGRLKFDGEGVRALTLGDHEQHCASPLWQCYDRTTRLNHPCESRPGLRGSVGPATDGQASAPSSLWWDLALMFVSSYVSN